jgi:hypothetical protein
MKFWVWYQYIFIQKVRKKARNLQKEKGKKKSHDKQQEWGVKRKNKCNFPTSIYFGWKIKIPYHLGNKGHKKQSFTNIYIYIVIARTRQFFLHIHLWKHLEINSFTNIPSQSSYHPDFWHHQEFCLQPLSPMVWLPLSNAR